MRWLPLLCRRKDVQARLDKGKKPHFLPETRRIRERDWKVGHIVLLIRTVAVRESLEEENNW